MIPDITVLVAAYIVTRMVQLIVKTNPKEHGAVVACAVGTIALALFVCGDVLYRGGQLNELLQAMPK